MISGDELAKRLMQMSATCRKCGEIIVFETGAQLAMENGISGKVVMCKCGSVFEVDINPFGLALRADVTERYLTGLQKPADQLASALQKGDVTKVKQAIISGTPLNGKIGAYDTAMVFAWRLACEAGDQELARLLLSKGGSVNQRDVNEHTPIEYAAISGQLQMVKFLLEQGAWLTCQTLMDAAYSGNLELVEYLVAKGADVNCEGPGLHTPLEQAALYGRLAIARYLIDHGAKVTNREIIIAEREGHHDVLALLKAHS